MCHSQTIAKQPLKYAHWPGLSSPPFCFHISCPKESCFFPQLSVFYISKTDLKLIHVLSLCLYLCARLKVITDHKLTLYIHYTHPLASGEWISAVSLVKPEDFFHRNCRNLAKHRIWIHSKDNTFCTLLHTHSNFSLWQTVALPYALSERGLDQWSETIPTSSGLSELSLCFLIDIYTRCRLV